MIIIKETILEEQLVPASKRELTLLKAQIEQNPMLKKQLTTPMNQLPQYDHLYAGLPQVGTLSLLSVLEILMGEAKAELLFSKAGNAFTGFLSYMDNGRDITGIKMASFFDDKAKANVVMANDLKKFIATEMPRKNKIEWEVEDANKQAIALYQKAIPKWFPNYSLAWVWDTKKHRWVYTIRK